jgi:hypothetical protein
MANYIYGLETGGSFYRMDAASLTIITSLSQPTFTPSTAQPAWDGAMVYMMGTDGKLYRYNPGSDTWSSALAAGYAVTVSGAAHMVSDGTYVYYVTNNALYAYSITQDLVIVLGGFTNGVLVWDYANAIYSLSGSIRIDKINLATRAISANYSTAGFPTSSPNSNAVVGGCWTNGKLFVYTGANTLNGYMVIGTESGTEVQFATATDVGFVQSTKVGTAISPNLLYAGTQQSTSELAIYNTLTNALTTASLSTFVDTMVFTLTIQSAFEFLEADGVTPMAVQEFLTGDGYAYPTQLIGALQKNLLCVYPRSSVTLAVAQDPTSPLSGVLEIATQQAGPYSSSVNMGQFAANQQKSFWIKGTVPTGFSPGEFFASLTATAN